MEDFKPGWYIVKPTASAPCAIVEAGTRGAIDEVLETDDGRIWGPFASPPEAIAKRVGLIRAGKCQPR